jgi:hypothetical protein
MLQSAAAVGPYLPIPYSTAFTAVDWIAILLRWIVPSCKCRTTLLTYVVDVGQLSMSRRIYAVSMTDVRSLVLSPSRVAFVASMVYTLWQLNYLTVHGTLHSMLDFHNIHCLLAKGWP